MAKDFLTEQTERAEQSYVESPDWLKTNREVTQTITISLEEYRQLIADQARLKERQQQDVFTTTGMFKVPDSSRG